MYVSAILLVVSVGVKSANILGFFMYPSFSHQIVYKQICKELSLRGHKVTIVTPNPSHDPNLTNLTEISVQFVYDILNKNNVQEKYSNEISANEALKNIYKISDIVVDLELDSPQVRKLFGDSNQKFDLILIHFFHSVFFGLGEKYKAPVISIASLDPFSSNYISVGSPNHPVLYPEFFFNFIPGKPGPWEKIKSVYFFLWQAFYHKWVFLPRTHKMARKYFGDVPYIGDLEKSTKMLFVYRSVLMEPPRPMVPAVVDISFINTDPPRSLPEDLQKILDGASEGVVYVSFGSNVKTGRLRKRIRSGILEVLPELPYTILLKWDCDHSAINASNIIAKKWFPQKDLLAHQNVKLFVTQGGLQSSEEAILGEVPLLGLPFMVDQSKNVRRLVELGVAESLDANNFNKTQFKNLIIKIAEDISYRDRIKTVRTTVLDKAKTGLENAVWWCEYVIRRKGAKHLRSVSIYSSFFTYFGLDLLLVLILFIFSTVLTLFCTV